MQVLEKHPSSLLVFLLISRDPPNIWGDRRVTDIFLGFSGVGSVPLVLRLRPLLQAVCEPLWPWWSLIASVCCVYTLLFTLQYTVKSNVVTAVGYKPTREC